MTKRDQESDCHCTVFAFSFSILWLRLTVYCYAFKLLRFSREREIQAEGQRGIEPKVTMIASLPSFT